ncbi:hypothetical protein K0M31_001832 [Melipona bicolor]|uniref:Uncharacterized protein n=1 Tax=Melipona bicolor TaxID=60889 RepID=A0AA40GHF3_9HYME|nr:hypothetical protein K0M31_001832 [Melipona bicolor]
MEKTLRYEEWKRIQVDCGMLKGNRKRKCGEKKEQVEGKEKAQIRKRGLRKSERKKIREEGRNHREISRNMIDIIVRKEREERVERIKNSNYNRDYSERVTENLPEYLKGSRKKKERCMIVRFRCENEWKGGQHWEEEEERMCRLCGETEENIISYTRGDLPIGEFLDENGRGVETTKKIMEEREKGKRKSKEQ